MLYFFRSLFGRVLLWCSGTSSVLTLLVLIAAALLYLDLQCFAQIKELRNSDGRCCVLPQAEERRQSRNIKYTGVNECIAKDCAYHAAVEAHLLV